MPTLSHPYLSVFFLFSENCSVKKELSIILIFYWFFFVFIFRLLMLTFVLGNHIFLNLSEILIRGVFQFYSWLFKCILVSELFLGVF